MSWSLALCRLHDCAFILLWYRLESVLLIATATRCLVVWTSCHTWVELLLCKGSSRLGSSFEWQMRPGQKNTGAWPEVIWILMAIWLAGHAKQGGRTFIRGADPTTLRQHAAAVPGCCHGSRLLWRLIIHQRYELWFCYKFLDDLVCILPVKTDKSEIQE